MNHPDRLLGRLEEFKEWAKSEFNELKQNQHRIMAQLDSINRDRWILYGKFAVLNFVLVIAVEMVSRKLSN